MLEYPEAEAAEGHGWERRIQRPYEVFVKPLCLFDLEAYPRY